MLMEISSINTIYYTTKIDKIENSEKRTEENNIDKTV